MAPDLVTSSAISLIVSAVKPPSNWLCTEVNVAFCGLGVFKIYFSRMYDLYKLVMSSCMGFVNITWICDKLFCCDRLYCWFNYGPYHEA
jgi:hypothetical protein